MNLGSDSQESAYNFASEYLKSMKYSLDNAKVAAVRQDCDNWYHWLRAAYREVSLMTTDDEDKKFENFFKEINSLINDPKKKYSQKRQILFMLDRLEIDLRKTIQKKDMGIPTKRDAKQEVLKR